MKIRQVQAIRFGSVITNDRADIAARMKRGETPIPVYREVVYSMVAADMGYKWERLLRAPILFEFEDNPEAQGEAICIRKESP